MKTSNGNPVGKKKVTEKRRFASVSKEDKIGLGIAHVFYFL